MFLYIFLYISFLFIVRLSSSRIPGNFPSNQYLLTTFFVFLSFLNFYIFLYISFLYIYLYISFPFHCKTLSPCLLHISSLRIRGRSRFSQKPGILCALPFLYFFLFWPFPCTHLLSSTFPFILLHFASLFLNLRLSPIFSPKKF